MKHQAEELAVLANFTHTVNDPAEGARVAARLDPIGRRGEIYRSHARTRLYWTHDPACACILLTAFRDLGDFAALFRDKQNVNEYVVCM